MNEQQQQRRQQLQQQNTAASVAVSFFFLAIDRIQGASVWAAGKNEERHLPLRSLFSSSFVFLFADRDEEEDGGYAMRS